MNARVLLVTRFRDLSMKVAGSNRDALTIVHVAWLSDAIRRLEQSDRTMILPPNRLLVRRDGHELPIEDYAALIYDRSNSISGMVVVIHDLTESRAVAPTLAYPAEHDALNPLLGGELPGNRRKQGTARAPTQNKPLANERRSSLYPEQHRPWRSRSAASRALS